MTYPPNFEALVLVAVTFNDTAATAPADCPIADSTETSSTLPFPSSAPTLAAGTPPAPLRVSKTRTGVNAFNPYVVPNQPLTSTTTCDATDEAMHTLPVASTGAITAFGTI